MEGNTSCNFPRTSVAPSQLWEDMSEMLGWALNWPLVPVATVHQQGESQGPEGNSQPSNRAKMAEAGATEPSLLYLRLASVLSQGGQSRSNSPQEEVSLTL